MHAGAPPGGTEEVRREVVDRTPLADTDDGDDDGGRGVPTATRPTHK